MEANNLKVGDIVTDKDLKVGDIVTGKVIQVETNQVLVDVGYAFEGTVYKEHLSAEKITDCNKVVKVGDDLKVKVTKISHGDDKNVMMLSCLDLERKAKLEQHKAELEVEKNVEAKVTQAVKGGMLLKFHGIELFVPDSLVSLQATTPESLQELKAGLVGKNVTVKIIEIRNEKGRDKYIASRKQVEYEVLKAQEKVELAELTVGKILKGTVERITDFGAFVKIGEHIEGLIHISELSHYHTSKVEEVVKVGDEVTAKIIKIAGKKISLSIRSLQEKPWDVFIKNHKVGDKVMGKVWKKMQFGMLIEVEKEIRGFISRFDYSWNPNDNLAGLVQVGDQLELQITSFDLEKQQFTLSKKHLEYNPWADFKIKVGDTVSATVKSLLEKGALVEVSGVEGFLPINELKEERVQKVDEVVKVGDVLQVEVLQAFPKEWKLTVSLKKAQDKVNRSEFEPHLKENVSANQSLADLFAKYKK
jgi:small subunit ribosomal protein S1